MKITHRLGANVKKYRGRKKWSQEHLGEVSGLHRTYISGIERGTRNPTIEVVETLARSLGVSAADLLAEATRQ